MGLRLTFVHTHSDFRCIWKNLQTLYMKTCVHLCAWLL